LGRRRAARRKLQPSLAFDQTSEAGPDADGSGVDKKITEPRMPSWHPNLDDLNYRRESNEADDQSKRPIRIASAERQPAKEEDREMLEAMGHVGDRTG
jgi:hypothetical protein